MVEDQFDLCSGVYHSVGFVKGHVSASNRDETEFVERSFVLRRILLGLYRPRLAFLNQPGVEGWFHHSLMQSRSQRTMILASISPPYAGRPGAQSDFRWTSVHHAVTRAPGHASQVRLVRLTRQHPVQFGPPVCWRWPHCCDAPATAADRARPARESRCAQSGSSTASSAVAWSLACLSSGRAQHGKRRLDPHRRAWRQIDPVPLGKVNLRHPIN